ncbi:MAG: HDOD domain-containing protein [Spirochaetota bacterium]|nr:MAG: HDOD domain-containing protein [Spirochaetota bacterium]
MEDKAVIKLNRYIDTMPSLSITVAKILEVTKNPRVTAKDLNKVISLDPVLVGRVLKLVNSAYYGLSNKVTSLVNAIIMLGINTIKNLALSTAVLGHMGKNSQFKSLNIDGFWRHSIGVGVASRLIAMEIGIPTNQIEEFFIAGLLHDIGKIPLNEVFEESYLKAIRLADFKKVQLLDMEKEIIGITHAEVGKMISDKWRLSPETVECILHHHNYNDIQENHYKIGTSVYIANIYCNLNQIGFSGDRYSKKIENYILESIGLNEEYLDELFDTISAEIEKASVFLQVAE